MDNKSIFSQASKSVSGASINTHRMNKTISKAIQQGFPEIDNQITPNDRATNCQMKVQLDALKRVIDDYE